MASNNNLIFVTIVMAALLARYGPINEHQIAVISEDGSFKFYADEHPDGSHTYESSYVSEHGWLLAPQAESGNLSERDWLALRAIQRYDKLPKFDESDIRDPNQYWGVLRRGDQTIVLREAEWNDLASTKVNESLHSMVFKAKASL